MCVPEYRWDAYESGWRFARRLYVCDDCRRPILAGELYVGHRCLERGEGWQTLRSCYSCACVSTALDWLGHEHPTAGADDCVIEMGVEELVDESSRVVRHLADGVPLRVLRAVGAYLNPRAVLREDTRRDLARARRAARFFAGLRAPALAPAGEVV